MTKANKEQNENHIAIQLDAARRREIDAVRDRMSEFLKGQLEIEHELKMVAKNQDNLKERFEMGVSKTVRNIDEKLDKFMIQWGRKQKEDEIRDDKIKDNKTTLDLIVRSLIYSVGSGLIFAFIMWSVSRFAS